MTNIQLKTLAELKENLHISHSQITTYLNCPLRYMFTYVQGLKPKHINAALPFGRGIHKSLEYFYRTCMEKNEAPDVRILEELFADAFSDDRKRPPRRQPADKLGYFFFHGDETSCL